jgi:hypothetical protein
VGKPTEDFDRKFDEINGEVSQRSETEATWAQTTQYRPNDPDNSTNEGENESNKSKW